jgi:uncharacterized membrane protein YdjX (TVP38/TMEM64 family)
VALAAVALYYEAPSRVQAAFKAALDWLEHLGYWAPIVFVVLYVASCVAVLPASVLTLGGGAVFGVLKGAILVNIAATLGATAAFLVGRYVARDWVTRRFGHHPTFAAIDRAVAEEGWKIVFLTRLAPMFPFFLMNYVYSLTRVRFSHYLLATWLGIIPGSTLFVFIGWTLRQAGSQQSSLTDRLKYGFIIVTGIIASIYLSRVARRALARRIESPADQG